MYVADIPHITQHLLLVDFANRKRNYALMFHHKPLVIIQPRKLIRLRFVLHLQSQIFNKLSRYHIFCFAAIDVQITQFTSTCTSSTENIGFAPILNRRLGRGVLGAMYIKKNRPSTWTDTRASLWRGTL